MKEFYDEYGAYKGRMDDNGEFYNEHGKFSGRMNFANLSYVLRMKVFPVPRISRNCFGLSVRLRGQKRVPEPPAIMMQY